MNAYIEYWVEEYNKAQEEKDEEQLHDFVFKKCPWCKHVVVEPNNNLE